MDYLCDYHIHSGISLDARGTILEICACAVQQGLREIAVTEHYEMNLGSVKSKHYELHRYQAEVQKAEDRFKGRLQIKTGIELGQPHHYPEGAEKLLGSFAYDYVIGSAHKLADGTDVGELDFTRFTLEELMQEYLIQLSELVKWGNFDCLGHLDLIKRYGTGYYKKRITLHTFHDLLTQILKDLISKGKGIEINTSGLRQVPKETMPGIDVLTLYRELHGEILTVGSDAHNPLDVGKGVKDAVNLAIEAGFRYITVFNKRKPEWKRIGK